MPNSLAANRRNTAAQSRTYEAAQVHQAYIGRRVVEILAALQPAKEQPAVKRTFALRYRLSAAEQAELCALLRLGLAATIWRSQRISFRGRGGKQLRLALTVQ